MNVMSALNKSFHLHFCICVLCKEPDPGSVRNKTQHNNSQVCLHQLHNPLCISQHYMLFIYSSIIGGFFCISVSQLVLWGWTKKKLHHRLYTHPIREWEGQAPHTYGDIIHSSSVYLHSGYTKVTIQQVASVHVPNCP